MIGTADTEAFVRSYQQHWIPRLADRYRAPSNPPANAEEELMTRAFSPEQMLDADLEQYPAHLHIDLLPPYQGVGNGRRIIERFFESAAQAGARGVHVVVAASNTGPRLLQASWLRGTGAAGPLRPPARPAQLTPLSRCLRPSV